MILISGCRESPTSSAAWFSDRTADAGVSFTYEPGEQGAYLLPEVMGGGVALVDVDGDGDLDLYAVQAGAPVPVADTVTENGSASPDRLFLNDGGWQFRDVTDAAGLADESGYGQGVAVGDIDADGDMDLFVLNYDQDRLYANDGQGHFRDVTDQAGIPANGWSVSGAFCDYNLDGALDLFIVRYVDFDPGLRCTSYVGLPDFCGPQAFEPSQDRLLRNTGDGAFEDVTAEAGLLGTTGPGLGVTCDDYNGDGWLDFYVANDMAANHLWIGGPDGQFENRAVEMGVAFNGAGRPEASMGIASADLDGDQAIDLFLTHLALETNTLYVNLGAGGFVDETQVRFPGAPSMPDTGFGVVAVDLESDADLDLVVANGGVRMIQMPGEPAESSVPEDTWDRYREKNSVYVNDGQGRFSASTEDECGLCSREGLYRGVASGDLDGDGDPDVVIGAIGGLLRLFENRSPQTNGWLRVQAVDERGRDAINARVEVTTGDGRTQVRTVTTGGSYASASEPAVYFGLGAAESVESLTVTWPDGGHESFHVDCLSCRVTLQRGEGETAP